MSKKIYINPGHSEKDPGAVGYETERRLNVKVSNFMNVYLLANYDCETRVYSNDSLGAVCEDANKWGADLFVSNHFNAGGGDGYEALVYSQKNVEMGKIFAKHVEAIGQNMRLYGAAPGVKIRTNLHVLKYTYMPAVLNEGAFVDNLKDITDWNEDHELKALGIAYAKAAAEYLGLKAKAPKPVPTPAKPAKQIEEDGLWGSGTTTRLQEIFGTTVDGIVSNQWACYMDDNPGLVSGWDWDAKPNGKGSQLIKAMQKWAGMPAGQQDGEIGPKTISAFQAKLGTPVDGVASKPSQMVKALQKWANKQ